MRRGISRAETSERVTELSFFRALGLRVLLRSFGGARQCTLIEPLWLVIVGISGRLQGSWGVQVRVQGEIS